MESALIDLYEVFLHKRNILSIISDTSGWREFALQCVPSEDLDFPSTRRHEGYMKASDLAFFFINICPRLTTRELCT